MSLISKNKLPIVDVSIKVPREDDPKYRAWLKCNNLVLSWLQRTLSSEFRQSMIWIDYAYNLWADLFDRFSQGDFMRICYLQQDFFSLQQGTLSVTAYYTQLKIVWDEMCNLRPLNTCDCSVREYRKQDFILKFLKGLNESFSVQRSQILMMKPMPTINEIFSIVVQHERSVSVTVSVDESNILLARRYMSSNKNVQMDDSGNNYNSKRSFNSGKKPTCTYCGINGHFVDKCYRKHGFPPGYKSSNRLHTGKASRVSNFDNQEPVASRGVFDSVWFEREVAQISASQVNALSSVFDAPAASGSDSEATDHIVNSISFFSECSPVDGFETPEDDCQSVSSVCFDLIHMDVWSPFPVKSIYGHTYFSTVVYGKSRFLWIFPMKAKSEVIRLLFRFYIRRSLFWIILCLDFASFLPKPRTKMHLRAVKCVFLGFPKNIKGFRLYDLENKYVFVSRDVFTENSFPFRDNLSCSSPSNIVLPAYSDDMLFEDVVYSGGPPDEVQPVVGPSVYPSAEVLHSTGPEVPPLVIPSTAASKEVLPQSTIPSRNIQLPKKYKDLKVSLPKTRTTSHSIAQVLSYDKFSCSHKSHLCSASILTKPKTYSQAVKH
ncbi:uncharacterized protein LOC120144771 [Hibiscus syriacus]|uniref:uncharacterized protein LOC120144771 n=1 Tax=Hibiscus syriacus TaxID=106335 RepID=UPI0019204DCC|nr:uncharacterized protein LOC120144771 [Hibiscus syriacus]